MKIAVAGKGGVGKTSISAGLVRLYASRGPVWAVDADPDACLAWALGIPEEDSARLTPFSEMRAVMKQRLGGDGGYLILNPKVDDLLEEYALVRGNIRLIRMGGLKKGGAGCYCHENAFLNAVITSVLVDKGETAVIDLAAGVEQLSRGAARGVDVLLVVGEPTRAALSTARNICSLAEDLGIKKIGWVANKVRNDADRNFVREWAGEYPVWGYISRHPEFEGQAVQADGVSPLPPAFLEELRGIAASIE